MNDWVNLLNKIVSNIEKVIIGKKNAIELILISLICDGHALIEDVPGVGKTTLVSSLSKSIDASFRRIQFTPDILPSDITGFSMYNQKEGTFDFHPGSIMSNIILADEINRTSPKTQASLLEVMEEKQVTVDGKTYFVPRPFMVLATQNPIEYLGTYPLPEAQLDRFFMKVSIGYPSKEEESSILSRFQTANPVEELMAVASGKDIISIQDTVKQVFVDKTINNYIVEIVTKTRYHSDINLGASPRASLSLFRAAQAWAFYNGRSFVIPEDVKYMAIPVLSHRIVLKQEARLKKISAEEIISAILQTIKISLVDDYGKK
ncbi:MAG: MoxR family ATPase [Clostridiaceae bacterium]|jgi:MoxR-like ATPase|nr:MoxR family ATPase [Clostridiaceae bacterium]